MRSIEQMTTESTERRRFNRLPLSLPASGRRLEKIFKSHPFTGKIKDMSYEGLCLKVDRADGLQPGQRVKLKTRLFKGDFSLKLSGIIRWVGARRDQDQPVDIGVKLTRIGHYGLWCDRIENGILQMS